MVSSTKVPSFIQCNNMSTDKDTDKDKKKTLLCACGRAEPLQNKNWKLYAWRVYGQRLQQNSSGKKRVLTCMIINKPH